jgi:uncharacterized protein (DUF58 family)
MLPVPTAIGWKGLVFQAALVAAFFAAPYANLFFLLLVFLTLLGGFGYLGTWWNLRGVQGTVETPEAVPAAIPPRIRGWLDVGSRPRYSVSFHLDLEGGTRLELPVGRIHGRGRQSVQGESPRLPRGVYRVERASLVSTWPFGFFRARRGLPSPGELVVYPTPTFRSTGREGGLSGDLASLTGLPDSALQPSSLREYLPGDPLQRVHWKASARRGELVIQEWEGGTGSGYEVVLDRRTSPATLETCLSLVSGLGHAARDEEEVLTLHTQGLVASYGGTRQPWTDLWRSLAGAETLPATSPPPPAASPEVPRLPGPDHTHRPEGARS